MTATNWIAFSAGRVVAYLGVGFVENAVPAYESEIAPTALRGFIAGSLIMLVRLTTLSVLSRGCPTSPISRYALSTHAPPLPARPSHLHSTCHYPSAHLAPYLSLNHLPRPISFTSLSFPSAHDVR
jgi:hypothetical protein